MTEMSNDATTTPVGAYEYLPFTSKTATDFALSIQTRLIDEIDAVFEDEDRFTNDIVGDGTLVPSLVLLADMSERHGIYLPVPVETVEMWRDIYMDTLDDAAEVVPAEYIKPRRYMLTKVFATLLEHAQVTEAILNESQDKDTSLEA